MGRTQVIERSRRWNWGEAHKRLRAVGFDTMTATINNRAGGRKGALAPLLFALFLGAFFAMLWTGTTAHAATLFSQPVRSLEVQSDSGFTQMLGATTTIPSGLLASSSMYIKFTMASDCDAIATCMNGDTQVSLVTTGFATCFNYYLTDADKEKTLNHKFGVITGKMYHVNNPGCASATQMKMYMYRTGNTGFPGYTKANAEGQFYVELSDIPFVESSSSAFIASSLTKFNSLVITGSTTITTGFFLDPNDVNRNDATRNPTQVRFSIAKQPGATTTIQGENISLSTGQGYATTTFTGLTDGTYDLLVTFGNTASTFTGVIPFSDVYLYSSFVVASGTVLSYTSPEYTDGSTPTTTVGYQYQECSVTKLSGCLNNSLVYLFVPGEYTQDTLKDLFSTLSEKFPFSYIYDITAVVNQLDQTGDGDLPTLTIDMGSSTLPFSVNILSKDTVNTYVSSSALATLRGLMEIMLWLSLTSMIFFTLYKILKE